MTSLSWIGASVLTLSLLAIHFHRPWHGSELVQIRHKQRNLQALSVDSDSKLLRNFQILDKDTCLRINTQECETKCTKKKIRSEPGNMSPKMTVLKGRSSGGSSGGGGRRSGGSTNRAPQNSTPKNPDPECVEDCLTEACKFVK